MAERSQNLVPGLERAIALSDSFRDEIKHDDTLNERQRRPMLSAVEQLDAKLRGALAKERMPKPRRKGANDV